MISTMMMMINQVCFQDEKIVDNFLAYHKWKDMEFFGKDNFPPSKPIEKMLQPVQQTQLYSYLRELPKGGNLHSHEGLGYSNSGGCDKMF